ncbi:holocytochrome c synthase [Agyrium rufum]|nr:holocytochrome c synthase [Agyrium rufum]
MGWFWADAPARPVAAVIATVPPHPISNPAAAPPPSCPMHNASTGATLPSIPTKSAQPPESCPIKRPDQIQDSLASAPPNSTSSTLSKLNPLNYMPHNLSQTRAPTQTVVLPTERTLSSIPRGDSEVNWEYPSPQQMYNAMLRKGYDDTPQDAVESMVAVHNFLNEGAWEEIKEWERRFGRGLSYGLEQSLKGDAQAGVDALRESGINDVPPPRLVKFHGRPGERTPKASILQLLGQVYPSKFGGEPPFDRHDWYVRRTAGDGRVQDVRYVIDYYSGPPESTGEPVFYLDVRPAVDSPKAAVERMIRWGGDVWYRASGAAVRGQEPRNNVQ